MRLQEHLEVLNEATSSFIDVWQGSDGDHKSSIGYKEGEKAYVLVVINHNSKFMFSKKDVPKIIKLLKMKNSPLIKE